MSRQRDSETTVSIAGCESVFCAMSLATESGSLKLVKYLSSCR